MNWEAIIAPAFCNRLCLSLLHSFWLIALLAVATRVVDYALRRRTVQTRYAAYTIGLCVSLGVLPVIFSMVGGPAVPSARQRVSFEPDHGGELVPFGHSQIISRPTRAVPPEAVVFQPTPNEAAAPRASSNALAVWSRWSPWIAGLYLVGVLAMLARLVRGIGASHRLFRHAEIIHEGPLVDLVQSVATRWSMRVAPPLARAQEIVVPKVIGFVRPTILLPMSAVTGLSNDELSMIITHEMAHVRRYDMWVNLLQRLVETLLFFNPAVWYISRRISTLREYCCDEMACEAIAETRLKTRVCYASALLRVAEMSRENVSPPTPADKYSELATLAASGRTPSELRRRVAHLFGEPIREPFLMSHRGVLIIIAVLFVWLISPVGGPSAADSTDRGAETEATVESNKATNPTVESQGHGNQNVTLRPEAKPAENQEKPDDNNSGTKPAAKQKESGDATPPFERPVSLNAKQMPLRDALAEVCRQARVPLQLDLPALAATKLNLDRQINVNIRNESLSRALGLLIDWQVNPELYTETRGGNLFLSTRAARDERVLEKLPDSLKPFYRRGMSASLDDDGQIAKIHLYSKTTDDLLEKLKTLPKLRELNVGSTTAVTPKGLAHLADLPALEKLSLHGVNREGAGLGDAALESVRRLKTLRELTLGYCGTTDAGAKFLEEMPQLTHLSLQEGRLTDAALTSIAKLRRLKYLGLTSYVGHVHYGRMRFTDDGVRQLASLHELEHLSLAGHGFPSDVLDLRRLKSLHLGGQQVDDEDAARIAQCASLGVLTLMYTSISDEGLKQIATLSKLRRLELNSYVITDNGTAHLTKLPQLQYLKLRATKIGDPTLGHVAKIKTLTRLDLDGSGLPGVNIGRNFTGLGYAQLAKLPNLNTLWLDNADVRWTELTQLRQLKVLELMMPTMSEEDVRRLQKALPQTSVSASGLSIGAAVESKESKNRTVGSQGHGKKKENPTQKRRGEKPKAPAEFRRMQVTAVRASDKQPIPALKFKVQFWQDGKQHQASYATNSKGVAELNLPTNRNLFWIRIEAHPKGLVPITLGWNGATRRVFSPPAETMVRFESGVSIGGIVRDQMGTPVRGAKVELHAGQRPEYPQFAVWNSHKTVSDKAGRWRWDVAPADLENLKLSISHPDYANKPVFRRLKSVAALDAFRRLEAEFELIEGITVSGRITDKQGKPIADARVAVGEKRFGSYIRAVKSQKDGSFAIKYSKAGPSVVTVEAKGYGSELRQVVVSPDMQMLKFAMKSPRVIRGRVVDPSGKPIAGAFAAADTWRGHRSLSWRVDTDAQGRFEWKSAPHDAVLFDFGAYGHVANRGVQLSPQEKEHVITLQQTAVGNVQEQPR